MKEDFLECMRRKNAEQKRVNYALLAGLAILLLSLGLYALFQFSSVQRSYLYPYPYQDEVRQYAEEYEVDSDLVIAVIKTESNFKEKAKSHRGAVGLMQIMPDTAKWIAKQLGDKDYSVKKLHEPETNIRYGIWYLSELQKEFDHNPVLVLAAYNAGRGNVKSWMKKNHWDMDFEDIDEIPFGETREYVRRVLKNREKYRELYR
ncbi:MAG: lytic transglycosylase domain-containing protein [Selenomonadaceae bacterium]|nr:lytic transglycosylase domain-containing protein [Selenomonadaceae bacterium]MBR4695159.1 lytic transglycosylase domain-containing protein [Selenomonadaceae bacterium]